MKRTTAVTRGLFMGFGAIATAALIAGAQPAMAQASEGANVNASGGERSGGMSSRPGSAARTSMPAAQVRQIQQALNDAGHNPGKVDGVWGKQTSSALKNFQQSKGLNATGRPDRQTLAALGVQQAGTSGRSDRAPLAPGRGAEDQGDKGNTATSRSRANTGGPGGSLDRSQRPMGPTGGASDQGSKGGTALPRSRNNAGGAGGSMQ